MKTKTLGVWLRVCVVLTLATGVACSGGVPFFGKRNTATGAEDSSSSGHVSAEPADSLKGAQDDFLEADLLDALDDETLAARANEAVMEGEPPPDPPTEDLTCEITAITGYRSDARARVHGWHGLSGGLRVGESGPTGYAGVGGRGVLRGIHVGRFTFRAGERLILGRGMGSYASSGSGAVREGFAVSPSLSRWFGRNGAALGLEWAGWRCQTVVLSSGQGSWSQLQSIWGSAVKQMEWGTVGMTAGEPLGDMRAENAGPAVTRPRVFSWHGSFRGDGFSGSCEVARLTRGQVFFAARMTQRGRPKRCRWTALLFRAPYSSPNGVSGLEPSTKADQGVRLDFSSGLAGVRASVVLIAGRTWSSSRLRIYRRLSVGVEHRGRGPVWWEASAQARSDVQDTYTAAVVVREISSELWRELRLRAAVGVSDGKALNASARIEYLPRIDEIGSGVLLSLATELVTGRIEARVQLSAHSLPRGRRGFASRPGIGPFEFLAPLYGDGSDLSMRLRARVWGAAKLVVFYGSPWLGAERLYLGAEYRR